MTETNPYTRVVKMYTKIESPTDLIHQLNKLSPEINKSDWLNAQNIKSKILSNALELAAENGSLKLVKLIATIPNINLAIKQNGAIRFAAEQGHLDIVTFLCTFPEVDPGAEKDYAIGVAAKAGYLDIVKILSRHPKVNPAADNYFALRFALSNQHLEVVNHLASLPCYNPFLPNRTPEEKSALITLFRELKLESHLKIHHLNANPNGKFLFFHNASLLDQQLVKDVKQVIVQKIIDLDSNELTPSSYNP